MTETRLPVFPTTSYVAFSLAVPFIQGALFSTMNAGTDLARDIQTGFLNRLTLTPMRRLAVLGGQLGGVVTLGLLQAVVYLAVGFAVGVHFASGPLGVLVLGVFALLISLAFGALGTLAALRTGSGEAVQGLFPAFFVFLFISSMNIPRNLLQITWFRDAATLNPLSVVTAVAGGLSRIRDVLGFDYPLGYTSFQFVFVLLQSAAFGGVFTGFGIARDFESGFARRLLLAAPHRSGIVLGYGIAALV